MKIFSLLVLLVLAISCSAIKRPQGIPQNWRLIQTSENNQKWVDINTLPINQKYFDITDHANNEHFKIPTPSPIPQVCRFNEDLLNVLQSEINMTNWVNTVQSLQNFGTRYYTNIKGKEAAEQIRKWAADICGSKCTADLFPHSWLQPSVIVTFQGQGKDAEERVIIGAHLDSTATNTNNAPGADDDASGVAVLLETLNVLIQAEYKPKKTLEFQFYAAEEVGLRGSQDIASTYAKNNVNVYAMVQFDMVGYNDQGRANPIFVTDYVNADLTRCLMELASQFPHHPKWGTAICGYACSDHASYNRTQYRSSHPFEAPPGSSNPYIHTTNDVVSRLSPTYARLFVELSLAASTTLSSHTN